MSKYHYEEFLKMAKYEHKKEFLKFSYKEDRLDVFLGNYISSEEFKDLWYVFKIVFVLSLERGFSVNKEILQENLQEKSLISQWLIHDTSGCSNNAQVPTFTISSTLKKSCKFAHTKYKAGLEKQREEKEADKRALKRKSDAKELANTKKQKTLLTHLVLRRKV